MHPELRRCTSGYGTGQPAVDEEGIHWDNSKGPQVFTLLGHLANASSLHSKQIVRRSKLVPCIRFSGHPRVVIAAFIKHLPES